MQPSFHELLAFERLRDEPFANELHSRMLLFDESSVLSRNRYEALADAAREFGDESVFAGTLVDGALVSASRFGFDEWLGYFDWSVGTDHAVVSPRARWALVVWEFGHIAVGGTDDFSDVLRQALMARRELTPQGGNEMPEMDEVRDFLSASGSTQEQRQWCERLLRHLYGTRADEILAREIRPRDTQAS